jgi:hypothetical protein
MANLTVKDSATAQQNWKDGANAAGPRYSKGVSNPKKDWATNTAMAEPAYNAGTQAGIARGAYGKGVKKKGTQAWKDGAVSKGVTRYPQGVTASGTKYQTGIEPFLGVLATITAPARGPKGAPQNYAIVQTIGDQLHQKKLAMQSAG